MADRFHQLILFEDFDFKGDHKHVFRSLSLSAGDPWNDRASSFVVTGGAWQFFRDSPFLTAVGSVFCPRHRGYSDTRDYDVQDHTLSSMRLLADDERIIAHIILFSKPNFAGDHMHVFRDTSLSGSWRNASSAIVFAGSWQLNANAAGQLLGPGTHPTFTTVPNQLVAIHLVNPNLIARRTPDHLILFDDRDFGGGHEHVVDDISDLGNWKGRVSAVAVEAGRWELFEKQQFGSQQGTVLTRGIYPWVEDLEINNDHTESVRRAAAAVAIAPLASLANLNDGYHILTAHGENYRLGWNQHEVVLTPDKVRLPDFGRVWFTNFGGTLATPDGQAARVYSQPLYVSGVAGGPQGTRDLVIVLRTLTDRQQIRLAIEAAPAISSNN
jgi:Beta/Gamma crystallin